MSSASQRRGRKRTVKEWVRDNPMKMAHFLQKFDKGKTQDRLDTRAMTQSVLDAFPREWDTMLPNGMYLAQTEEKGLGLYCMYDIDKDVLVCELDVTGAVLSRSKSVASAYAITFSRDGTSYVSDPGETRIHKHKKQYMAYFANEPSTGTRANTYFHEVSESGETRVFLHSCRRIKAGTEITVHYGRGYSRAYQVGQECRVSKSNLFKTFDEFLAADQRYRIVPLKLEQELNLRLFQIHQKSSFMDTVLIALCTDPCEFLKELWASRDDRFGQEIQRLRDSVIHRTNWIQTCQEFRIFLSREKAGKEFRDKGDPALFLHFLLEHYQSSNLRSQCRHLLTEGEIMLIGTPEKSDGNSIVARLVSGSGFFYKKDPSCVIHRVSVAKQTIKHLISPEKDDIRESVLARLHSPPASYSQLTIEGVYKTVEIVTSTPYHIVEILRSDQGSATVQYFDETCNIGDTKFRLHAAIIARPTEFVCWFRVDETYYAYDNTRDRVLEEIGDFAALSQYQDSRGATLFARACLLFYSPVTPMNVGTYFNAEDREKQAQLNTKRSYLLPKPPTFAVQVSISPEPISANSWQRARALGLRPPDYQRQSCYMDSVFVALFSDFHCEYLNQMWNTRRDQFGDHVRRMRAAITDFEDPRPNRTSVELREFIYQEHEQFRIDASNDPEEFLNFLLSRYAVANTRAVKYQKFVMRDNEQYEPIGPFRFMPDCSIVTSSPPNNLFLNPGQYTTEINFNGSITTEINRGDTRESVPRERIESYVTQKEYKKQHYTREKLDNVVEASVTTFTPYHIITMYRGRWRQDGPFRIGEAGEAGRIDRTKRKVLETQVINGREFRLHAAVIYQPSHYLCWFRGRDSLFYNYNDMSSDIEVIGDFDALQEYKFGRVEISTLETHACILFYSPTEEHKVEIAELLESVLDLQRELEDRHKTERNKKKNKKVPHAADHIPRLTLGGVRDSFIDSVLTALMSDRSAFMKGLWSTRQDHFGTRVMDGTRLNEFLETRYRAHRNRKNDPMSFLKFFLGHYAASKARTMRTQYFVRTDSDHVKSIGVAQKTQSSIITNWSSLKDGNVVITENVRARVTGYLREGPNIPRVDEELISNGYELADVRVPLETMDFENLIAVQETQETMYHIVSFRGGQEINEYKVLGVAGTLARLHAVIVENGTDQFTTWVLGVDQTYYDSQTQTQIGSFDRLIGYKNQSLDTKARILFYAPLYEDKPKLRAFFDRMVAAQLDLQEREPGKDSPPETIGGQVYCGKYKHDPLKVPVGDQRDRTPVYAPGDWSNLRPLRRKGTLSECQTAGFRAAKAFIYKMQ